MPKSTSRHVRATDFVMRARDRAHAVMRQYPRATTYTAIALAALFVITCGLTGYYYVKFQHDVRASRQRDACSPLLRETSEFRR